MNVEAHLTTLQGKKAGIDEAIVIENKRPSPDNVRISQLKREKLRLKEEIERCHLS
ncbi:YdcH family protein [Govanella unica]|uniref:DUF465 domain-containing protein n=1 Tax=Govanella unica TaxID=2975056 RepID=A0A9X3U0D9_9PROT|nr:DUF465 domain-containing protein [Govania unica]MDA5194858.1 DUF465 domain-containing protein [Govania unica]